MSAPTVVETPLGVRREYVFSQPLEREDWSKMEKLLGDLTIGGFTPLRFIHDDSVRVVITTTGDKE